MLNSQLIKIHIQLFLIAPRFIYRQNINEFQSWVSKCGMIFENSSSTVESKIIENDDMDYEYSVGFPDKIFDLRYAIRPIRYKAYENDIVKQEMETLRSFRNSSFEMVVHMIILNITGGVEYEIRVFDADAVKNEFRAGWGATTWVELNSDFGKGYKNCMIVAIHKKDVADAYCFYLADTKQTILENMDPLFHTLRFDME